jgi:hypothetical protein
MGTGSISRTTASRTEVMAFGDCLSLVDEVSAEMGVAPIVLLRTRDVWLTRLDALDGAVTITCSRPDRRVTVKRFQNGGQSGPTAASAPSPRG